MTDETFDSSSDDRVRNNVMRHKYRVLSNEEKSQVEYIKNRGFHFVEFCDRMGSNRELSLAKTRMQEVIM